MTFTATATIQSIEKLNDKFFKVLLQDERSNHIVVNVPIEKAGDLALNVKISVWGNVSAFQYQSKWYNNLFAQTIVPENKKYLLLHQIANNDSSQSQPGYAILEYNSELFSKEYISNKYKNSEMQQEVTETKEQPTDILSVFLKGEDTPEYVNIEYSHLQNLVTKKFVTLENSIIKPVENTTSFVKNTDGSDLIVFHRSPSKVKMISIEEALKGFAE